MVRDKEKKEIVSKTKVPSSEYLSSDAELPENQQNKTDNIEVISGIVSSIDENNSSLDYIENRISTIKRIARKHNIEENEISSFKNKSS